MYFLLDFMSNAVSILVSQGGDMRLMLGDSLDKLKELDDNSVDSVVTDPPYGLAFMGKKWDYDVPSVELWKEVFRVLKPGGHLLSFGGTRTYHRMVVNIEDAGFEIRDQIMWLYGSGFPKSYNISKGIDKKFGIEFKKEPASGVGFMNNSDDGYNNTINKLTKVGESHDLAKQWDGFGTALKPANEPIVLARKPLSEKNIVENVLKWGVGGLNIDGCRIEGKPRTTHKDGNYQSKTQIDNIYKHGLKLGERLTEPQGRFPANLILDETAAEMIGEASRFFYVAKASKRERNAGLESLEPKESGIKNDSGCGFSEGDPYKKVLNQNHHPTVKPIKLMQYLVRLITPPQGTVLDPFMGSGTTGIAAKSKGFDFVGIEREQEYLKIATKRIEHANKTTISSR